MTRFVTAAGFTVYRIRINAISREERRGRVVWVKRRRRSADPLVLCANAFFRVAGNPVAVWQSLPEWQRWEIECFEMLNGDAFGAFAEGLRAVCADHVPGQSLCRHLDNGTLAAPMLAAAGRELRRAHGQSVEFYSGQWSHGDPHLGNFLFDPAGARCRLIDFEVTHHRSLTPEERHTDDLLVPLLDLCGRLENEAWVPMALSFLAGYDNPELLKRLKERLRVPRGMPRLWWAIRTSYIGRPVLTRRLETLRAALP